MKISVTIVLFLYALSLADPVLSAVIITSPLRPRVYIYYGDARDAHNLYMKAFSFGTRSRRSPQRSTPAVGVPGDLLANGSLANLTFNTSNLTTLPPRSEVCTSSQFITRAFNFTDRLSQGGAGSSASDLTSSGQGGGFTPNGTNGSGSQDCAQGFFFQGTTDGGTLGTFTVASPTILAGPVVEPTGKVIERKLGGVASKTGGVVFIGEGPDGLHEAKLTLGPGLVFQGDELAGDRRKRSGQFHNGSHIRTQTFQRAAAVSRPSLTGGPVRRRQ